MNVQIKVINAHLNMQLWFFYFSKIKDSLVMVYFNFRNNALKISHIALFFSFLCISFSSDSQAPAKVDSLEKLLLDHPQEDSLRLKVLLELTGQTRFYDLKKASDFASQAEELSLKLNDKTQYGRSLYYEGMVHYMRGFLDLGLDYGEKSAEVFKEIADKIRLSAAYELLGVIHTDLVNDEKAINYLREVLKIAEELGDDFAQISSNSNIGNIYLRQGNKKLARSYYKKAEAILENSKEPEAFSEVYINLASVTDDREQKLNYYEKARLGFEKAGMTEGKAQVLAGMGKDFAEQKRFAEAINYFKQAIEAFEEVEFDNGKAGTLILLSEAEMGIGQYGEAEKHLLQAAEIGKNKDLNEHLMTGYESLATFYEKQGRSSDALRYYKLFSQIKEQNFNASKTKIIEENEARYQSEKKELRLAEQELELSRQKSLRNQILWWAVLGILAVGGVLGYYYFRQQQKRIEAENALKIKDLEARNLKENERIKSAFFTNISHEFRTPLTLIISPLQEMIKGTFSGNPQSYFKMMLRNGQRLLELVNQLLDLAKLEVGSLELHKERADINGFIKSIASSFESLAEIRGIRFFLTVPVGGIMLDFDKDKIQKIITNLLSNAFKFTPENGEVRLEISQKKDKLQIDVSDSGIGIPQKDLPHIFDRFYQVKDLNNIEQSGSGIGLALVKELVELHGGTIEVRSRENEGTLFSFRLPLLSTDLPDIQSETIVTEYSYAAPLDNEVGRVSGKTGKPVILVAEDHHDVQLLIKDVLQETYEVIMKPNGKEALEEALEKVPDAIVSDVMMPEMDGFTFCEKIKSDTRTSHIPVVMLTARADQTDKMRGLETGADAYLPKPFDAGELKLRLQKLIELRQKLRQNFSTAISLKPEEMQVSSIDQQFIEKVKNIIETHVSDEQFGVETFAEEIGMSRSQLNRKLKAIFNQSANEMVRIYRLEKAHQLLSQKALSPTEASYQLGFSSPAYFSKCFSDHYGYAPSRVG
ncbi:response regulator [Lacihabitans sp. LS3-19]|uniref:hybrid sensor histidine kinase/response regulator transcription factor n=1 Tax=Lacihabitans sp. LS3-19 TaxID=2487335 RepID=UPI0020CF3C17|nr:ATP-binding protein [Lacihabitans sp. LS3-19]MCP9767148.1 response regulator [Lacihabitans sp. LS3-19]